MIVAAGLSPAYQQIAVFDRFTPGEVNRAREMHHCASGKVLNVGISLAHLRAEALTICPLGGLPRGAIEEELEELNVPLVALNAGGATRACTTIIDRASGATTELVEESRPLTADELSAFTAAFAAEAPAAAVAVLTGSLPPGTPSSVYRELLTHVRGPAVLNARGPELREALAARPLMVKPNREELARTVGRSLDSDQELLAAMRELNVAGAGWVIVTAGRQAVWLTGGGNEAYRLQPAPVAEVVNPIGCGDALAAGIAAGLVAGREPLEAVRYGMGAAADRLRSLLPGRLDRQRVEQLAREVRYERVS